MNVSIEEVVTAKEKVVFKGKLVTFFVLIFFNCIFIALYDYDLCL